MEYDSYLHGIHRAWLRALPSEDNVSFISQVPSENLPQYTPINQLPDSSLLMVPPLYTLHHDTPAIDAPPADVPTVSAVSNNGVEPRTTSQSTHVQSSEIEPYPLDLQPTLDPNSKEVREHVDLFPEPFLFSSPTRPAIGSRVQDKKSSESAIRIDKGKKKENPGFDDDGSATPLRRRPLSLDLSQDDASSSSTPTPASPISGSSHTDNTSNFPTKVVTHVFQLNDSKDAPWTTFTLESRALTPQSTPVFHGDDIIKGHVYLTADSGNIQAVTLTITGQLITRAYGDGEYTFLDNTATIWSKSSSSRKSVSGGHSWPIHIPFPDTFALHRRKNLPAQVVNAPPSFLEKEVGADIRYQLVLRVCRGRFKSDSKLETMIRYVPTLRPGTLSPLMQLAYAQNAPLPGPKVDLIGWFTLKPITVRGKFGNRQGAVEYTLSLANPLCYTRGSVIPFSLMVKSQDFQVLDTLASPNVISVVLKQRIQYYEDASTYYHYHDPPPEKGHALAREISTAKWWIPSKDGLHATTERRLEGELHLDDALQPSCEFPLFTVEYLVTFYSPECALFQPASTKSLISQRVRIGTAYPVGCPLPRSFTTSKSLPHSSYDESEEYLWQSQSETDIRML